MGEPWFRRNERGGKGPGLPIHRNGWILLGFYVAYLFLFPFGLEYWFGYPPETMERFIAILAVTIPVYVLAWKKTQAPPEQQPEE